MIQGKIWGQTELLLSNSTLELHKIQFKAGKQCSMHRHMHKYNAFYCIAGELAIHVKKNNYDLTDVTILKPGGLCIVPPGEFHRFVAHSNGSALEIYWAAELDFNDIERQDVGGDAQEK